MSNNLSAAGAADNVLARKVSGWWTEAAAKSGIDVTGFEPEASLATRISWALKAGLLLATCYLRFSSKPQHSDEDQARANTEFAAQNGMYLPPEFVCLDKATTGRRVRRAGLDRLKNIMGERMATVLLVFSLSRLFRRSYEAHRFFQEQIVEENLRGISVSESIDTADARAWKLKFQVHGMMDEMLLEAIAENCREGLIGLFLKGWVTGAVGVGYRATEVPGAPHTNRGLPRKAPKVDPDAAELIVQHFQMIRDGMTIMQGWRRWVAEGGPCDPRSTQGHMTYHAYRRLLSNIRLTGRWEFGRNRNRFSSKLDYVQQVEQPDASVKRYLCEELRIVDDALFLEVQQRLAGLKLGPRGPHKRKDVRLWDLTTEFFFCAECSKPGAPVRFHQTGAHGKGMQCKKADLCPCKSAVRREEAVRAVCKELTNLISRDAKLIESVTVRSCVVDAQSDQDSGGELASLEKKICTLTNRINDLYELSGQGSEHDRAEVKARIRSVQTERAAAQLDIARIKKAHEQTSANLSPDDVRHILADISKLLEDGAAGKLGDDAAYKALAVFRRLTGGCIWVHVERRPGRKQTNVRGVFGPQLVRAVKEYGGQTDTSSDRPVEDVSVWLREPPRLDALAEPVHHLLDTEGLSYRDAAKQLRKDGYHVNSGNVWYSYRRWYEMNGLPVPKRPYNNGRPRKSE